MNKNIFKKNYTNKPYNVIKKIKACIDCHKIWYDEEFNNMSLINIKTKNLYKKLYNFKILKNFNKIMNNITLNLKNKYILDICKFFNKIKKIRQSFTINNDFIWRW